MTSACESCPVRDRAACAVLDEAEREALARAGRTRTIRRGEMLFAAGDEEAACATLVSGALKVSSYDRAGEEQILALIHPAGFVGEMFQPFAQFDVTALTESQLCTFSKRDMERALQDYPSLTQALFRRSQEDLHAARELLALSGHGSAEQKVASLVVSFGRAASDSPCHPARNFELPLTRGEMANMLGLTIETVSRQLTKLEKDGLVRKQGTRRIELIDPARLAMLAG